MPQIKDEYYVYYKDKDIGVYYIFDNGLKDFNPYSRHEDIDIELKEYGLDQRIVEAEQLEVLDQIIKEENRLKERKKIIYVSGPFRLEREAKLSGESFSVYRRSAEKGEADYSPLAHDAPHYEGSHTPTTAPMKRNLMKPGAGAEVTMRAVLCIGRSRRNGSSSIMTSFWKKL